MAVILRLLENSDKNEGLLEATNAYRSNGEDRRIYKIDTDRFSEIPGAPFAYWVGDSIRECFSKFPPFESCPRTARQGLATAEDFRFVRLAWEPIETRDKWFGYAKGGPFSPFYADVHLLVNWHSGGAEVKEGICKRYPYLNGNAEFVAKNTSFYLRPGLTWPRRTKSRLSMRAMPAGCVFADKGPAVFVERDSFDHLLALMSLASSTFFHRLIELQLAAADAKAGGAAHSFEVGVIQKTPVPEFSVQELTALSEIARRAWSARRLLDSTSETSHAFLLPLALRQAQAERLGAFDPPAIEAELARIQAEIDDIAFDLYGFSDADRAAAVGGSGGEVSGDDATEDADAEGDEDEAADDTPSTDALLSWSIGVAFGRFDIRLATGERAAPPEPEPFDPLPAKGPGMLPDGDAPFHAHTGILVDDPGHAHDLVRIAERVLERVDMPVPAELRRWLQKDFFPFHLQRYSKSRRKAPIYWPLSTASGSYTLWLYYPSLTSQTLYSAINDFVEPKLAEVETEAATLRSKGSARSRDEEKRLEALTTLEAELRDLRDQLQAIAPHYQPNHDDGVQITAAPLWPLFRHKPWQKVLKDTWAKLEKGDYDWAHLAMTYWPERVRERCRHDKSLAIAHGLEELYVEPPAAPKKARGRKKEVE